ncbi:Na+/H+ antiporter subunit A [Bacillus sp. V5-8f]|uniref:Na+/H+ antiporter subunit A n=1 Tax=Bacillus sp. V5-8f TaxID=2053044 RepID=UPI000C75F5CA|nr:Na+/H+ antiporter subunit A [Bacillus sp. V5-8f]PLT34021.1 Na+/H+ antiporter subunit A [Bacillus sp. V5-8f]
MSLLHWAILSPFIMAIFIPPLYKQLPRIHTGWFVFVLPVVLFIYFLGYLPLVRGGVYVSESLAWIPSLGINFDVYLDGLSLLFALLITGIGALVMLYSVYYLNKGKEKLHTFYVYLLLFMGSMLGLVLSDNLILLYMFWEFTSLSSFLLIGYWYHRERSRYGAQKSLLITVLGGLSMLGGFVLLSFIGDTYSIRELIGQNLVEDPLFIASLLLVLLGAFSKSAQFPFHIWLPDAMEAPTPVSAYLHSATMVKAGIYLVARLSPVFAESSLWFWLTASTGIVTLIWGSYSAVKQTDLKAILAYSTISQLGMIMAMLGAGAAALHYNTLGENIYLAATVAAVFHLINHATFKGSLFMAAGIIDHETGTRDIRRLGGLMNFMPITFTITTIGAFSMAGLPPFNGFLSKEMFFTSMVRISKMDFFSLETWGVVFPVVAWLGSIFTFVYSMIIAFKPFRGKYKPEQLEKKPHEAPLGMLIPPIILASLVIILGIFPNILAPAIIEPAVAAIQTGLSQTEFQVHIAHWHGLTIELFMTIGVILLGCLLYLTWDRWKHVYHVVPGKLSLNRMYDALLFGLERGSIGLVKLFMTGYIRTYLVYIFLFFIVSLGFTLWWKDAFALDLSNTAPVRLYEVIIAVIISIGAIVILFAKSRLTSIIILGAVGYMVSLFFVLFRAPDLALTQLVIETISVALFLLCFYHLPKLSSRKEERLVFRLNNALISIGVGVIVTLIALSAHSNKFFETISSYYVENAYKEAGGKNIVNVILVDFRGLDTMFEITVLGIAALGIFALIKLRLAKGALKDENK